ncbi:hypothetical protein ACOMHN_060950 [Nucella lapillus]
MFLPRDVPTQRCSYPEMFLPRDIPTQRCSYPEMFLPRDVPTQRCSYPDCDGEQTECSYIFVCDFRPHCQDKTDEAFCKHPPCDKQFTCLNGQCVPYSKRCDKLSDCLDDSDERDCVGYTLAQSLFHAHLPTPVLVNFDGIGEFVLTKLKPGQPCPHTHYRCPGDVDNCLPVYTRCNEMFDCVGHEDEEGCGEVTCPGFFRCRSSAVCVHSDHLCDGWPHCPLHEDELLCDVTCPVTCLCHGRSFLCPRPFPAHLFPQLRHLDGAGSGVTFSDLKSNTYLVYLSLARCSLSALSIIALHNLCFLDLSHNKLDRVNMSWFAELHKLNSLSLANNPLSVLSSDPVYSTDQTVLKTLDLSHTGLKEFDSRVISQFKVLRNLDLSFCSIQTIGPGGFKSASFLTTLSMEDTPVEIFQPDVFKDLSRLSFVRAKNYKFCCKAVLPKHLESQFCFSPADEVSSCEDLLQTDTYRAFLWLISGLAVTGNVCSFMLRQCVHKASVGSYSLFVSHRGRSDLLMGIYLSIIGVGRTC